MRVVLRLQLWCGCTSHGLHVVQTLSMPLLQLCCDCSKHRLQVPQVRSCSCGAVVLRTDCTFADAFCAIVVAIYCCCPSHGLHALQLLSVLRLQLWCSCTAPRLHFLQMSFVIRLQQPADVGSATSVLSHGGHHTTNLHAEAHPYRLCRGHPLTNGAMLTGGATSCNMKW